MYYGNYRLQKTGLLKCIKSPVLEHPSTVNMLNSPKHYSNLHDSSFNLLRDHSGKKLVEKRLC